MSNSTRNILRHFLPIILWLLVGGGIFLFYMLAPYTHWEGALILLGLLPLYRLANPHTGNWAKEAYTATLLMGISSYWVPTILLLTPMIVIHTGRYRLLSHKMFIAILLGYITIAIYAALFIVLGWCKNPWEKFFDTQFLWGWIPIGVITIGIVGTIIIRNVFEDRMR